MTPDIAAELQKEVGYLRAILPELDKVQPPGLIRPDAPHAQPAILGVATARTALMPARPAQDQNCGSEESPGSPAYPPCKACGHPKHPLKETNLSFFIP